MTAVMKTSYGISSASISVMSIYASSSRMTLQLFVSKSATTSPTPMKIRQLSIWAFVAIYGKTER
jgi:hypothetical protein